MASWLPHVAMEDERFTVTSTSKFSVLDLASPGSKAKAGKAKAGKAKAKAPANGNGAAAEPGSGGGGGERSRVKHLLENERQMQQRWDAEGIFESQPAFNADGSPKPKFMVTFPYPYMNGRLHLGHAFSLTKAEFAAGFKRLKGFNVLFPFGFHCTGMPIQAAANRLRDELAEFGNPPQFPVAETAASSSKAKGKAAKGKVAQKSAGTKYQWDTLKLMGITDDAELAQFADPLKWLDYFPPFGVADLRMFGASIDWRRSFITTSRNPYYNKFIEWQFRHLRSSDKVVFGKRPSIYSPRDQQVCADHDRASGEGVGPQEYTIIKLRVKAPFPPALAALEGRNVFLAPATLRPETMYGQTNCFVLPSGEYGAFEWANGDVYVMAERSAKGLAHQSYQNVDFAHEWGKTRCLCTVRGRDLLGLPLAAPRAPYDTIYVYPLESILMNKGTGVVTSVPSDAPTDYVMFMEMKTKQKKREEAGLEDFMCEPFEVVPIINITVPPNGDEPGWSSDICAKHWVEQLKIKSPKDLVKLEEAKKKTYNAGFSHGTMLVGPYAGEKVSVAKEKEKQDMIAQGDAFIYFEPEDYVGSRSGEECVVAMTDQWYLKYGEPEWRDQVLAHVNSDNFEPYSQEILDRFNRTLHWLKEWACSRLFGLGTQLPWDQQWVIESLSDSTIYMAYYTIAHMLQGKDNLSGDQPSPASIQPEQLTDAVFNFIFLGAPRPSDSGIPVATLDALKAEFEYWYPMDLRVSGRDLIGNHLTMSLYNHAAIWADRPEMWPRGFYTNGFVMINHEKMSKSTGNFLMLDEAVLYYSADATRFALADAGDTLLDANFERDVADVAAMSLFNEEIFIKEVLEADAKGELRSGELLRMEMDVMKEMDRLIHECDKGFTKMFWRDGIQAGAFGYRIVRDFYRDWCSCMNLKFHRDLILRWIETSVVMLSPICPHFAEMAWGLLGKSGSVLHAQWPAADPVDALATRSFNFLRTTVKSLRATASKAKSKQTPTKAYVYVAEQYSVWKVNTLNFLRNLWNDGLPAKKELMKQLGPLVQDPAMAPEKKNIMQFAAFMADEAAAVGIEALDTEMPYDQKAVLEESIGYLSKQLINGATLDVSIHVVSNPNCPGDKKKMERAEPSKPSLHIE